ncbi:hypothetical protein BofuT4_P068180.1 [Botrytis cinerea T4]|uniref:Uncharacterized protein n=1 Tax=Botryotinia fuckeliana (strain T4) TaxID=999810 RepID=G2XQY5_BOTF4|nr:hypothetical protein BofuT4_P068180.1 [Botrytis cinerea T4]
MLGSLHGPMRKSGCKQHDQDVTRAYPVAPSLTLVKGDLSSVHWDMLCAKDRGDGCKF